MPPAVIASTSVSGAFLPPTNAFASLSIAAPPTNRPKLKDKLSSGLDELTKKLRDKIPDLAVFTATMTGLPLIRDAVNGVQELQDWRSCRDELDEFRRTLERLLAAIKWYSQNPKYAPYTSPPMAEFKEKVTKLLVQVQTECARQSSLHYNSAKRVLGLVDDYRQQALVLIQELLASLIIGALQQQDIMLPEEYDMIIPTLRSLHWGNGLVRGAILRADRYDGGPVEHAPVQNLHVISHQGTYKNTPVEIKEYFGGPEDQLLQNVKELVEHYQTFDNNANLAQLFGGSVSRLPDGQLCVYLVFSPTEGEPWVNVAKAQQSVELLCQVAEETMQIFDYLRIKKQMNWEGIKIRADGTLTFALTTQGDNFLLTENVWDVMDVMDLSDDSPWPIKELFKLFQEADRQGITRDAIAALRAHTGPWDKIAVWKAAKLIGLRPAEQISEWRRYPPPGWQVHTGMIVASEYGDRRRVQYPFDELDMMPRQGLTRHDLAHLRGFRMVHATGVTEDGRSVYFRDETENWFERSPDGEWEYFVFEPWEDLKDVTISYESSRLDSVPWEQWKTILRSCAKRRNRDLDDLGVITRLEGFMSFDKRNCPELGTRPLYFYRKRDQASATSREFWGFFSFNLDPNGAPGIDIRVSDDVAACIVSDSVPVGVQAASRIEFEIVWVNMRDDWDNRIKSELEERRLNPFPMFEEKEIEWSDDEGEPGW